MNASFNLINQREGNKLQEHGKHLNSYFICYYQYQPKLLFAIKNNFLFLFSIFIKKNQK